MTQIQPIGSRYLIKFESKNKTTSSGIIIESSREDAIQKAVVVSVGTDLTLTAKVGETLLVYRGKCIPNSSNTVDKTFFVKEEDVVAIYEEEV